MNIEKEIWRKIILKENITVAEVIQNLEEMRLKIVLIVDENGSFIVIYSVPLRCNIIINF